MVTIVLADEDASGAAIGMLWGKSNAGGRPHLLLAHLLDAAAVGELVWDRYLAPGLRDRVDACCDGEGRSLFVLLCGLHDLGKASPAFQGKVPELAAGVRSVGLDWPADLPAEAARRWHHTLAGAFAAQRVLRAAGWSREATAWVVPLIAGHHGAVPSVQRWSNPPARGQAQGVGPWVAAQDGVAAAVTSALGLDLAASAPVRVPSRAVQLALCGAMVMADWIASDDRQFPGIADVAVVSMPAARDQAGTAWSRLGLTGGWRPETLGGGMDLVRRRFGMDARPVQADAVALAEGMAVPGLLVLEAPMGEGKTEAALAAAEVLARRFGAGGVFVGMPTQATSDPMFSRVHTWLASVDPQVPLALLHGKRRFNPEWQALVQDVRFSGIADAGQDEYGVDDVFGVDGDGRETDRPGEAPAEWFLGRKRGLLVPVAVGTVDQVLHAATRTRHVMLRHTGLAGRVVVLDEIHAYDVYMAQFLFEALRWLADAGVPVILLSATLPPRLREDLVRAYLTGAAQAADVDVDGIPDPGGYPSGLSVCLRGGQARFEVRSGQPWRRSLPVRVEVLDEPPDDPVAGVVGVVVEAVRDGGCVLVVRNTVSRAQRTYAALRAVLGADAALLHARLTAVERAERTERVLNLLGPSGRAGGVSRPERLVVVATQLAEQSFDVDADLLVTDLAPIDLLLQRVGRLHRHQRSVDARPQRLRTPAVVVTGLRRRGEAPPWLPRGSRAVYGDYPLLRAAALVLEAAVSDGWSVPADVPDLVARGYDEAAPDLPAAWMEEAGTARDAWTEGQQRRAARAAPFLLSPAHDLGKPNLAGLHDRGTDISDDEDEVAAVVRDGDPSVEVVLVRRDEPDGSYLSLDGRSLGPTGEAVSDEATMRRVIGASIRLPAKTQLTQAALAELRPLPGWSGDPWLRSARALVLDHAASAPLGGYRLRYDPDLGLLHEWEGAR
jgi:CRISPR-associated endonuclease/helicase Cas3